MKKYLFLIMGMALCLASCNNNGAGKVEQHKMPELKQLVCVLPMLSWTVS